MDNLERLKNAGIIPVVIIEKESDAVSCAKALLAGGIDVMEITCRTPAAQSAISIVAKECPEMLVGAGTVTTLKMCKSVLSLGAKFIVCPGFSKEIVDYCVKNHVTIVPGCVTPTEIMQAMDSGLNVVKFFPADVFGGIKAMKNLSAPFGNIKFIPTGGINEENLAEYAGAPFVHAVGGSWICAKSDINAGNFNKITELCKKARKIIEI